MGVAQSAGSPNGTKRPRKGEFSLSLGYDVLDTGVPGSQAFGFWDLHHQPPGSQAFRLGLNYATGFPGSSLQTADWGASRPPELCEPNPIRNLLFSFSLSIFYWFFFFEEPQYQRLSLTGLTGENCPPHSGLGTQPAPCTLWKELQSRSQANSSGMIFHILIFQAPVPSFLDLFIWGLGQWSSSGGGRRRKPWRHLPSCDLVAGTLPLLAFPPHLPPSDTATISGSIRLPDFFAQGSLNSKKTAHLCWSPGPQPVCRSVGEMEQRAWRFLQVLTPAYYTTTVSD